jgi:L-ascorbate metabolism protein UlaG (beta-lactamase superfamily)
MFDIEYKGANSVVITSKKATIVTDPKLSLVGLKDVAIKDAVELSTEARFAIDNPDARLEVEGPGEYGVAEFDIKGIAAQRHIDSEKTELLSTIYRIEIGDVRMGLIGNVDPNLNDTQLEELGVIDILILPVGGAGYTLDATSAVGLVRKIDPKVVIPIHYADDAVKYEVPQDKLNLFLGELSVPVEETAKYKVKQFLNLPETLTVVKLTRS